MGGVGGWVGVGLPETKANSAKFQVKLPTGAELGNKRFIFKWWITKVIITNIAWQCVSSYSLCYHSSLLLLYNACSHHWLFMSLVRYGIGPYFVLSSLQKGTLKDGFSLWVLGPGSVFTNQWLCFGCFKDLVAKLHNICTIIDVHTLRVLLTFCNIDDDFCCYLYKLGQKCQ